MKRILIGAAFASVFGIAQAATLLDANFNTEDNDQFANSNGRTGFKLFAMAGNSGSGVTPPTTFDGGSSTLATFQGSSPAGLRSASSGVPNQWVESNSQNSGSFFLTGGLTLTAGSSYTLSFSHLGTVDYAFQESNCAVGCSNLLANTSNASSWAPYTSPSFVWAGPTTNYSLNFSLSPNSAIDNIQFIDNVSAVPEPGEWAMMLAGLGVVGAIARRRKSKSI